MQADVHSTRTATVITTCAIAVAASVIAILLWLPDPAVAVERDSSADRSLQELRASMDLLIHEVRDLRKALEERRPIMVPSESASSRVPAEKANESIVKRLEALAAALETRGPTTDLEPLSEIVKRPPVQGASALFRDLAGHDFEDFDWTAGEKRLEERHLFWSMRELLRQYGPPTEVTTHEGGLRLVYRNDDASLRVIFTIDSGVVVVVRLGS